MAQGSEQAAEQLVNVTARLEQLARQQRGGLLDSLRPFLLGALVGGAAALLYAPQAGEQTRAFVRRNATELQESATQGAQAAKGTIQERTGAAQETVQKTLAQAGDTVKTTVADGRAQANAATQEAKQAATASGTAAQTTADTTTDTAQDVSQEQARKAARPKPA